MTSAPKSRATSTGSWTAPTDSAMNNVLRLSTRESGTGQGNLITPAINGGLAPTFELRPLFPR